VHVARCRECRKRKPIATRLQGHPLCSECYQKLVRVKEPCAGCAAPKRVYARGARGEPLCPPCYRGRTRPAERCSVCGQLAHPAARERRGPICMRCYDQRRFGPCVYCRRTRRIARRARDGGAICGRCSFHRFGVVRTCAACGDEKRTRRRTGEGRPLCDACYMEKRRGKWAA
jgi:hypothetical protein